MQARKEERITRHIGAERDELGQEGDVEHAHFRVQQVGQKAAPEGLPARCSGRLGRA